VVVVEVALIVEAAADKRGQIAPRHGRIGEVGVAARDPDSQALAVSGRKWVLGRIGRGDHRSAAAGLVKPAGGPECRGRRDRTSRNARAVSAVVDNVPAWRIVHNSDHPENCVPQTGRVRAIGPTWPQGRDNVQLSPGCSDQPRVLACPGSQVDSIDRGPATGREPATSPAAALGPVVRDKVDSGPIALVKVVLVFDPPDQARVAVASSDPHGRVKGAAFSDPHGRVKTVAVNKSVLAGLVVDQIGLMVGLTAVLVAPMVAPDAQMVGPIVPVIVGPI
jgi:hypothetical protein